MGNRRVPDWLIERLALGELTEQEIEDTRKALEEEPGGIERLHRLADSNLEILTEQPAPQMAAAILRRAAEKQPSTVSTREGEGREPQVPVRDERRRQGPFRWLEPAATPSTREGRGRAPQAPLQGDRQRQAPFERFVPASGWSPRRALAVPALAACVAAVFLLDVRMPIAGEPAPSDIESIRLKGQSPRLLVHRMGEGGAEAIPPGAEVRVNDRLQLSYISAGEPFGVVISLDGNRAVTRHLPLQGDEAPALHLAGIVSLSSSYQLDDAPDFERFFFVTAHTPFSVDMVLEAAEALASRSTAGVDELPLPPRLTQRSILLRKVGNR